jgi:hypothetical protein
MKRIPCPVCRGHRFVPISNDTVAMRLCDRCRGLGTITVPVHSAMEALHARTERAAFVIKATLSLLLIVCGTLFLASLFVRR